MFAKLTALLAHEISTRVIGPVAAEYRKLDAPPACQLPHAGGHVYDVASTTGAHTERAPGWDHDTTPPVTARFGFGP